MRVVRAAAAVLAGATAWAGSGQGIPPGVFLPDSVTLRAGDVVLRQGTGVWSTYFARVNPHDRRFSHVGIVVGDGQHWRVVHARANDIGGNGRVWLDDWTQFVDHVPRLAVLRLNDEAAAAGVARAALAMHAAKLPFDFDFDLSDTGAVYCSELVWRALREGLGHDPLPVKAMLNGRETILVENFLRDMTELKLVHLAE